MFCTSFKCKRFIVSQDVLVGKQLMMGTLMDDGMTVMIKAAVMKYKMMTWAIVNVQWVKEQ